ncbi:MAG: hypothetical protein WCD18_16110, partial [Thermosynechococcaceae cyanobacterium]
MHQKSIPLRTILVATFVLQTVAAVSFTMWLMWNNERRSVAGLNTQLQTEILVRIRDELSHDLDSSVLINRLNGQGIVTGNLPVDLSNIPRQFRQHRNLGVASPVAAMYFGGADGQFVG